MDTLTLKQNLHHKIDLIDDEKLLIDLNEVIESNSAKSIYILTEEQIERVRLSDIQEKEGKLIPHEVVQKEIEEWLNSK